MVLNALGNIFVTTRNIFHYYIVVFLFVCCFFLSDRGTSDLTFKCNLKNSNHQ